MRALVGILTVAVMMPLVVVFGALNAGAATATITSAGPLTSVGISDQLNCSVNHVADLAGEFYGNTACGTFLVVDGTMYFSPASVPAGQPSTTPFTPVSQTGPTGSGTEADPYKIVTSVSAGATGVGITQTDTYVTGLESYRTDIVVTNSSGTAKAARVYRAADCYLQSSDAGYGEVDTASGAVACTTGLEPGSRIEQWFPLTPGSHYLESEYSTVWLTIANLQPFPDTCTCATLLDNGAGLSWDVNVAPAASSTISSLITFSPLGHLPLSLTKTADAGSVSAGGTDGYTITATNPNVAAVTLDSVIDTLPAGFAYVPGSTTGVTTANPSIAGQELTWTGVSVPGAGSASIHFSVTASSTAGTYNNEATATATGYTVAPTGPTAPITVTSVANPLVVSLSPASATNDVGTDHTVTASATRGGAPQAGVAASFAVVSGPNVGTTGNGTTDASGNATFTYTSATAGTDTIRASALDGDITINSNDVTKTWNPVVLPLVLSLTPASATNDVGTDHTVTATATRGGALQADVAVSFAVVSGPNVGATGSGTSDAAGEATFTYTSATAGTDTIRASALDGDIAVDSNDVTKTWNAVVLPLVLSLSPESATNPVGVDHTVTARATRGSELQTGVAVSFAVTSGPNVGTTGNGTSDASGNATFTYTSATAGTDTIRASALDGDTTVDSNDVSKTWESGADLSITSMTEPPVVTVGGSVLTTVTATNNGTSAATGVDVMLTLQPGSTLFSITPSQGTCDALFGNSVTCHLGTINGGGGTATISAVIVVPNAVPAGGLITTSAIAASDQTGTGGPVESSAQVAPRTPGQASGFVPPGGTLSTGTTATPADNTIISFTLPNSGPGAVMSLLAENDTTLRFCGGQRCSGKTAFVSPFAGYEDPENPAKVTITWDRTVAGRGIFSTLYVQKAPGGPIVVVPECQEQQQDDGHHDGHHDERRGARTRSSERNRHERDRFGPHTGIANPSPCVDARSVDRRGDVTFEILLLSGDPKFARR